MNTTAPIHTALQAFAAAVTDKLTQITHGEPEEQLRAPFENFMGAAAGALGWNVVCTGETPLPDRLGRPDYAVHLNSLLAGYVELKPAGAGAAIGFAAAVALGVLTGMAVTLLGQTVMLWTLSATGWNAILPLAAWICSGMVVPLPYLPHWAQAVLELLPFAGLIDTPFRIYSGHLAGSEALRALLVQAAWVVALVAAGHRLMAVGIRKVVIQGG